MSVHNLKRQVEDAQQFVFENWERFRHVAATAFRDHGRGALVFDLIRDREEYRSPNAEVVYLTPANAGSLTDGFAAFAMSGEVSEYDVARQIVFVFWNPSIEEAMIRVMREWPNGKPRVFPDKKWAFAVRQCPRCKSEFKSFGDWGKCPSCEHRFLASDVQYASENHDSVEPIAVEP